MEVYYELIEALFKLDAPRPKELGEDD